MQQDWNSIPIYMMDFEGSSKSGVVEYGVVVLKNGSITAVETDLCSPVGEIPLKDEKVHGINSSEVLDKNPFSDHFRQFVGYRKTGIFASHNRHAENNFLKSTWALPSFVPDWRSGGGKAQEWGPWIDTLAIYKCLYPGLESYALGELVDLFHLRKRLDELSVIHCPAGRSRPHCALYDALASTLLLIHLESEKNVAPHLSLGWLLQFSNGNSSQGELF